MKMTRILIQIPVSTKKKLDGMKAQGYTISGYIRTAIENELRRKGGKRDGRKTT